MEKLHSLKVCVKTTVITSQNKNSKNQKGWYYFCFCSTLP